MHSFNDIFRSLLNNFPFMCAVYAWFFAQATKLFYYYFRDGEFNLWHFTEAGGMPSSHSAMMCAVTIAIGLINGWTAPLFALSFVVAVIVMYDAAGVRRAAGKQALVLNRIVEDIYTSGKISDEKLKEIIGHTPFEVCVGALLGVAVTLIYFYVTFVR